MLYFKSIGLQVVVVVESEMEENFDAHTGRLQYKLKSCGKDSDELSIDFQTVIFPD